MSARRIFFAVLLGAFLPVVWCHLEDTTLALADEKNSAPPPAYDPVEQYEARQLQGWRVLVHKEVLRPEREQTYTALWSELENHLYRIRRVVAVPALSRLQAIPIWIEWAHPRHPCMCYHPSSDWLRTHQMNPDKAGAVEIANVTNFLRWTHDQPWMVLHELAHGYHHHVLDFDNAEIKECFARAVASKSYESVLRINGRRERHYALNDAKEYFAEATEAYFGANDFYPFVRAELKEHDQDCYRLLQKLWGEQKK